jgi:FAD/FMN-containing dehydrogenase
VHAVAPALAEKGISVQQLRADLNGRVIASGDAGYDDARALFAGGFDHHPVVILQVADARDIAYAISLARETGLDLGIRSGGHSAAGHSVPEGGIMLDLSRMRALDLDPQSRTAWAEAGLTAGEYTAAAAAHGLATGFGDTGSVGIGGLTLGGGVGYLVRKYGLTIDDLLAAEVVTADGQLRRADAENNPDLFWAIRGGGGNFGVATRFQYRLHPVGTVLGGMLILPATPGVIHGFMSEALAAPEELSTIANVMSAPPMPFLPPEVHGQLITLAFMVFSGDVEAGQRALAPFRALATPLADMLHPMPYPEIYPPEEGDYHPTAAARTMFVERIDRSDAEMIVEMLQKSDAPMRVAQLRPLGGAMARVPDDATAYAHRQAPIMVNMAAFFTGPDKAEREAWVAEFARRLDQGNPGAYVNFLADEGQDRVRAAYPGSTWDRLVAIKKRYDPENLFRLNQNIPPA